MKRALSLFFVLCMVMSLTLGLCSCGGDETTTTTTNPNASTTTQSGQTPGPGSPTTDWPKFENTKLKIQLSSYSDSEFTSGGQKYMAGPDNGSSDKVQDQVYIRNMEAYSALGLVRDDVEYLYLNKGWGNISTEIMTQEDAGSGCPDMYCDMVYDMMVATMNSCFYNIKNMTVESGGGHFNFSAKDEDGEFYLTEFMNDLTMSQDKMYLIGSQYYLDLIRGMFVMPINIDMYESKIGSIVDFYADIMDGKWTWDYMIELCRRVFNDKKGDGSTMDDTLVFAAETGGGKSASGILYSTDIHLVDIHVDGNGYYSFSYPNQNKELYEIFNKISKVFSTDGVVAVQEGGSTQEQVDAIRKKFSEGTLLIGGSILMGAVEDEVYQEMKQGFGLIPNPKFSEDADYNTLIHNVARVGAISRNCTENNRKAISAFIQYCSENSRNIVNEYYNYAMKYKFTSDAGTAEMLDLIYANVVAVREKALDDLIGAWNTNASKWHTLLISDSRDFRANADQIATVYGTTTSLKRSVLATLGEKWKGLP